MPAKVRKQIYLDQRQNRQLKRLAEARGVSEAEVVRELIDAEAAAGATRPVLPSRAAWEAILEFSQLRAQSGQAGEPYQWNRDEVYEERLNRFGARLNDTETAKNLPGPATRYPAPKAKSVRQKPVRRRLSAKP